ncbi:MAG TPA: ABC transporter permease [Longimicrobiales bacterium]|nr:ABC transporter permease [Longimicrobiales bacterium]
MVIKREFLEGVRTKMFIIGTLFGPLIMALFIVGPVLLAGATGGGVARITILDATGGELGQSVATSLAAASARASTDETQTVFHTRVEGISPETEQAKVGDTRAEINAGKLDGYLLLPAGILKGDGAIYEGNNASAMSVTREIDRAVVSAVREQRLDQAGIPRDELTQILASVPVEKRRLGSEKAAGDAQLAIGVGYFILFAVYMGVIMYGSAVGRGVQEEKRDRIVEVILSSIRARDFMAGKVLGIGATGLLQMGIWALFGVVLMSQAHAIAGMFHAQVPALPQIPGVVVFNFLFYFITGYFLYGALFAAAGAIATNSQELQQLQFPVLLPLIVGFLFMLPIIQNPSSGLVVVGSLIPFTAPLVVPMRSAVVDIPLGQWLASIVLMIATIIAMIWVAAKVYRVGVLSTGKRPTWAEIMRWLRTA